MYYCTNIIFKTIDINDNQYNEHNEHNVDDPDIPKTAGMW